jgi:hypothetical protein
MLAVAPDVVANSAYSSFYPSMMDPVSGVVNERAENFPGRVKIPPLPSAARNRRKGGVVSP